jgi:CoA-transferase family III
MPPRIEAQLMTEAWSAIVAGASVPPLVPELDGDASRLTSTFPVAEAAVACIATALGAAGRLHELRTGQPPALELDRGHVAAAVRSERYFTIDGAVSGMGFASLSRFWPAADGWVRTHANYSWHRDALLEAIHARDEEPDSVAASISARRSVDVEDAVFGAGGVAAAVRTDGEWRGHGQGVALGTEPLVASRRVGEGPARARGASRLPAEGVRVLDFTRVIAGPVCTRYLAALGADVLRLDPPHRRDLVDGEPADTLLAKRSAIADASNDAVRRDIEALLVDADVVVCGYRPGALDHLGLGVKDLVGRHPGLVVVVIDAWGHSGPWAARRGFDSVVQAASGIAAGESVDGHRPGVLPCQLLDHGTGYLAAAASLDALRRQMTEGGSYIRRLSLARTASWLTTGSRTHRSNRARDGRLDDAEPTAFMQELHDANTTVRAIRPPGSIDGRELQWPALLTRYATDEPSWIT